MRFLVVQLLEFAICGIFKATMNALDPGKDETVKDRSELINGASCNCPNDCEEVTYSQEISQARIGQLNEEFEQSILKDGFNKYGKLLKKSKNESIPSEKRDKYARTFDTAKVDFSIVHFYFKELGLVK